MFPIVILSTSYEFNVLVDQTIFENVRLCLDGGSNGSSWGWFTCNRFYNNGPSHFFGPAIFYEGIDVLPGGTKNFIQPHPTDSTKVIKYIAIEAGEAMTVTRGVSKTVGGSVNITLPEHFSLVTSKEAPLTVLLTPEGTPVLLYIESKTREHIIVVMRPSDFSAYGDAAFSWQVSGVRDGYENEQIICDADSLLSGISNSGTVSEKRKKMTEWAKKTKLKIQNKTSKK